jgi:hypothetical protein
MQQQQPPNLLVLPIDALNQKAGSSCRAPPAISTADKPELH